MSRAPAPDAKFAAPCADGSPPTRLILLRHGETDWNVRGWIQGRTDTDLNPQARLWLTGQRVPHEFTAARRYSSPLRRCVQTCECLGLRDVSVQSSLIEADWGEWEGKTLGQLRVDQAQAMRVNEDRGLDFRPTGGESPRDVLERLRPWLRELAQSPETALAITHRGVIRVLMAQALGWNMLGKSPVKLQRNALQVFQVERDGTVRPDQFNVPLESRSAENV